MSGSSRETIPAVWEWWEALPDVLKWSGDPLGCPAVVGSHCWMYRNAWETLPNVREFSGGPPGCPAVVRRPSWMYRNG